MTQQMPPSYQQPPRQNGMFKNSSCLAMFGCFAALCIGLGLVIVISAAMFGSKPEPSSKMREVWISGKGKAKIAVVQVNGAIMEGSRSTGNVAAASDIVSQLNHIGKDSKVKGVLVLANSPGGGVTASDKIYNALKKLTDRKLPVVVLMGDVCASGCVYMSAFATKIVAHPTSITGSIGVITSTLNFSKMLEKIGVQGVTIASKENKALLSPFEPVKPEHKAILKKIIDEMYVRFVDIVAKGRKLKKDKLMKVADGRVFSGAAAVKLGLVDQLGYKQDALDLVKKLAGVSQVKLVKYRQRLGLADIFLGYAELPHELKTSRSMSLERLLSIKGPRMYYMWSPTGR
ncbi:MAG: signal peptide peptidase SppA [Deltaproteobacteria bacterium]|nr:MAG: signal peptide peptidase SppA [Deltaproteobacteria bacterium]